jgi:hypothetical protein
MSQVPGEHDPQIVHLREMLQASPLLLPWSWDRSSHQIEFVGVSEPEYALASFLDERLLSDKHLRGTVPHALIADVQPSKLSYTGLPQCDFIFHISHCGSTLLSRLLGLHPHCFAIREPKILRNFDSRSSSEVLWLFGLLSRTFSHEQKSLIKATSFTSQFAHDWLSILQDSKAILLSMPLEPFLAAVLDGSTIDIEMSRHSRWKRLNEMNCSLPGELESLSIGQCAAMSWLCESMTLHHLVLGHESRTLRIDFDSLMNSPKPTLDRCAEFLGYPRPYPTWDKNPLWQQYAKKPGVAYNAKTRTDLLEASRQKNAVEIEQGIRWVSNLRDPNVKYLLNR